MKKKLLSTLLALAMVSAMSVTAFAADGTAADAPSGTTGTANPSTGEANVTYNGTTFNSENDDDALAKANDTDGTQIDVWAKVITETAKVYKVDITWGAMKFEFNADKGTWDPATHTYGTGANQAKWVNGNGTDNILGADGVNNKITVTNHSNDAVTAAFAYNNDGKTFGTNAAGAVVGNFFADNANAQTAALQLTYTNTNEILNTLTTALDIATAEGTQLAAAPSSDCFFAFSGTPGADNAVSDATFEKVGTITVTIAKPIV